MQSSDYCPQTPLYQRSSSRRRKKKRQCSASSRGSSLDVRQQTRKFSLITAIIIYQ